MGEVDVGVGGGLRGAAAMEWRGEDVARWEEAAAAEVGAEAVVVAKAVTMLWRGMLGEAGVATA